MSMEPKYEKPTYPGTGNGLSGDSGEYDIIVIGSGMGGLSCSALSAKYGSKVLCLESHIKVGGSAHTFSRMHDGGKYSFEVGPSIFEGLDRPSLNPLRMIFDILEETMPVKTYKGLGYWTPSGYWRFPIGSREGFEELLREQCGEDGEKAIKEWDALRARLKTLGGSTQAVALLNLRQDAGFLATTAGSLPFVLKNPDVFGDLSLTFDDLSKTVDEFVTVPFLRNFIDTMCIFCGFPAKGAMTAHLLYILERFFEETAAFCVPIGGTCELGETLQRGLEKYGGKLQLNAHVDEILIEDNRAVGVRLKNGNVIKARKAVVSNATPFDTVKLMPKQEDEPKAVTKWRDDIGKLPRHGAISHLFLAIDAKGLDLSHIDDPAHLVVQVSLLRCLCSLTFVFVVMECLLNSLLACTKRTGIALSKIPKIFAPSSFLPFSTKPSVPKESTSSMFTHLEENLTNLGKSLLLDRKNMKHTRRNVLKFFSVPLKDASLMFVTVLNSPSLDLLWHMKHSFAEIAEHTEWHGQQVHQLLNRVSLEKRYLSPSLT